MHDERPRCEHGVVHPEEFCANCLRSEVERLRVALAAVEWIDQDDGEMVCPWCHADTTDGHRADCQRQLALGVTI